MSSRKTKKKVQTVAENTVIQDVISHHDTISENDDPGKIATLKEETLLWIFCILGSLCVYLVIAKIIQAVYHPDIKPLLAEAFRVSYATDARPEPVEALLFRTAVITFGAGMLTFYFLFSKSRFIKKLSETPFFLVISTLCVAFIGLMIFFDFAAANPFGPATGEAAQNPRDLVGKTNFDFFFKGLFLGNHFLLYTFIAVPSIVSIFYLGIRKYDWENNRIFKIAASAVGYVVVGGTIAAVVLMNVFDFPYAGDNKFDFDAVYYSMTQVFAGTPMLTDGFANTYGLYPLFLNPVFQIVGLNIFKFSLAMALLTGGAYMFNFYFLKQYVSNKIILFLGTATVIFFPFLDFKFVNPFDCLFAFFSIRYIIPSTLILLTTLYLRKRSQMIYWITFVLMAFFVLWNPEIGMVSYLSWIAVNTYCDFYDKNGKVNIKKIGLHWLLGAGLVVSAFFIVKIIFYLVYGVSPDYGLLFSFILVFGKFSFGLLPMVLVHPWNMTALVLITGLMYSIAKLYRKDITNKASAVFLVTIIGIGFFVYFQGRSHNWPYATSTGFSFILLTILGDALWGEIKNTKIVPLHVLFVVFIFIISASFFETVFDYKKFNELVFQEDDKTKQQDEEQHIKANEDFIVKNSEEYEKIFVFSIRSYEGLYFDGNKRRSAFNPGFQDLTLNSDLRKLEKRIVDSSFSVFMDYSFEQISYMPRILAEVSSLYEIKESNGTMGLLKKRKNKMLANSYLVRNDKSVIHRKYADDSAGVGSRVNDALGTKPVVLNSEFSAEVIFSPGKQIFKFATIIGNMNDTSGFIIANLFNTNNYFFGVNGKGVTVPVPDTGWSYCVMNVFPDRIEVYKNGTLAGTLPLATPIRQSSDMLFVGNQGMWRYFMGAISEVAVTDKAIDKNQIQATWDEIKK